MKLLACWHIGKAKNAPFKLLLTTESARVAAELAPLCMELTFKGDVRRKMKGLESLITGWHRRSYFGCVSSLPEISTQGHETKITGTKGNERERCCISVQTSRRLLPQPPHHLGLNLCQRKRSDILELLPQTSQPTSNYPHCEIWIVSTHLRTAIQRLLWKKPCVAEAARQGCGRGQHPVVALMELLAQKAIDWWAGRTIVVEK